MLDEDERPLAALSAACCAAELLLFDEERPLAALLAACSAADHPHMLRASDSFSQFIVVHHDFHQPDELHELLLLPQEYVLSPQAGGAVFGFHALCPADAACFIVPCTAEAFSAAFFSAIVQSLWIHEKLAFAAATISLSHAGFALTGTGFAFTGVGFF